MIKEKGLKYLQNKSGPPEMAKPNLVNFLKTAHSLIKYFLGLNQCDYDVILEYWSTPFPRFQLEKFTGVTPEE